MSRRKKRPAEPSATPRVKLVCTDRGQHPAAFLGWVLYDAADERPVPLHDWPEDNNDDELQFLESATHARGRQIPPDHTPDEWSTVTHFDEHNRARDGHRGLNTELRERWQLAETCPRCPGNVPIRYDRLAALMGEAVRSGLRVLDVSRL